MPKKTEVITVINRYPNGLVRSYIYGQRPDYPPVRLPPDVDEEFCRIAVNALLAIKQKEIKAG